MIKIEATFDNLSERKDRSTVLKFDTRELSDSELIELRHYRGLEGWLLFDLNDVQAEDIPDEDAELEQKSKATRLRGALYRLQEQELGRKPTEQEWKLYYNESMEKLISIIKNKLN